MMLEPIQKAPSASSLVAGQLKAAIQDGRLKPGERLDSELELAKAFQTSRSSVREGIRLLVGLGFLESRPGRGTFVKADFAAAQPDAGVRRLAEFCSVHDLMEVRAVLEQYGASLAAARADEADRQALDALLTQLDRAAGDADAYFQIDAQLHRLVAQASRNRFIGMLVQALMEEADSRFHAQLKFRRPDSFSLSTETLKRLCAAIGAGEPAAAAKAMEEHLALVDRGAEGE